MDVPKLLSSLFDYQRFDSEESLQRLIDETEERYAGTELSDGALSTVSAAGDPYTRLADPKKKP